MSEFESTSPKRVLGAFPSFASQPDDTITSTGFEASLGVYGMSVLKHGKLNFKLN